MVPEPLIALALAALALVVIEGGYALDDRALRRQGHTTMLVAVGRWALVNFPATDLVFASVTSRLLTGLAVACSSYYLAARMHRADESDRAWEAVLQRAYAWVGSAVAAALVLAELRDPWVPTGWMAFALVLLVVGFKKPTEDLRAQSYLLTTAAFARAWLITISSTSRTPWWIGDLPAISIVVALLFVAQWLTPRHGGTTVASWEWLSALDRHARTGFALLGTALLTTVLFSEMSAQTLTMAWGVEAALVLGLGFVSHERALRLAGVFLMVACIVKLFAVDFRGLDGLSRIISFIVLGLLLVAASWVYTRYREQLHKYL